MRTVCLLLYSLFLTFSCFAQEEVPFGYEQFKQYFRDAHDPEKEKQIIPHNSFTGFLFPEGYNTFQYGIEKIEHVNGFDLFVFHRLDVFREDFENEEDLNLYQTYYLTFKDGKPVGSFDHHSMNQALDICVGGEGGVFNQEYTIDTDHTILIETDDDDCCISTGFETSFKTQSKLRFEVNQEGGLSLKEVLEVVFSSLFFDEESLEEKKEDERFTYPTREEPYSFYIYNALGKIPFYQSNLQLQFWIESIDNKFYPFLVSLNENGEVLDSYSFMNDKIERSVSDAWEKDSLYRSPIAIKTNHRTIYLDADGRFCY